jgi:hypothetical protein
MKSKTRTPVGAHLGEQRWVLMGKGPENFLSLEDVLHLDTLGRTVETFAETHAVTCERFVQFSGFQFHLKVENKY